MRIRSSNSRDQAAGMLPPGLQARTLQRPWVPCLCCLYMGAAEVPVLTAVSFKLSLLICSSSFKFQVQKCVPSHCHVWLLATPRSEAHQAPLSMGFSRQEYWSGLPFPPPGDLPNPRIESAPPVSCISSPKWQHPTAQRPVSSAQLPRPGCPSLDLVLRGLNTCTSCKKCSSNSPLMEVWEKMDTCMFGWVPSLSTWNYHHVFHQLYPNTNEKFSSYFFFKVKMKTFSNFHDRRLGLSCHHIDLEFPVRIRWISWEKSEKELASLGNCLDVENSRDHQDPG